MRPWKIEEGCEVSCLVNAEGLTNRELVGLQFSANRTALIRGR